MPIHTGDQYHGGQHEPPIDQGATRRLRNLARFTLLWTVIVLGRLFYLQVVTRDEYVRQAQSQQQRVFEIPAPRGAIFDRESQPLALGTPVKSVLVNPQLLPNVPLAVEVLSRFLELDPKDLRKRIDKAVNDNRGFLWVKRRIPFDEAERVKALKLTGVEFRDEPARSYPNGVLAAHVIGGVDHEGHGNAGIELGLQEELEGIPGQLRMHTDVARRGYQSTVELPAQPGKNVWLTIDQRIQYAAEDALRRAMEACRCWSGSVVVMNPKNGDILAMASNPTYDPNEQIEKGADLSPRLNLAVAAPFEPGSVFKVITLASALETTRLSPESPVNCFGGRFVLAGRPIREAKGGYGVMPMRLVLAKSSNIGAIQVGLAMGPRNFLEYITRFGFGNKTGVPLPAESAGRVHPLREWQPTSMGSVPMGHEITTTTIQLAQAAAVIANDGVMVRPRIVLQRQRPGEPMEVEPVAKPVRVIKSATSEKMRGMLEDAVLPGGTGTKAQVRGYSIGGKTGSAQIYDVQLKAYTHKYNASFMGIAPLNDPEIVVVVTLNGASEYGGVVAAPVFSEIATHALHVLDIPKDRPEQVRIVRARAVREEESVEAEVEEEPAVPEGLVLATGAAKVPNYIGRNLRDVLNDSASQGFPVEVRGSGIAKAQRPAPGSILRSGQRIVVRFAH